jgi:hypothetical protein
MKSVKLESLPLEMVWIADRLGIDKWEGLPVRETLERDFFVSQKVLEALARSGLHWALAYFEAMLAVGP